ncbi:MAG: hypothetical protein IPJ02_05930 [Chitinophagaceae bacterium]|nr:hypothetical protein [Chitinophagaceae bacterium]
MKRSFLYILVTSGLVLAGAGALAQNAAPETKPLKSTLKPESTPPAAPVAPTLQKSDEQQIAKPIVPGGEFKPRDTRVPQPANEKDRVIPRPIQPPAPQANLQTPAPAKKTDKEPVPVVQQH